MEDIEEKIEEINGEVKRQITVEAKACSDQTNLAQWYRNSIRRKQLTELKVELGNRISTLESCVGADAHGPPGIPAEWTEKLDIGNLSKPII